MFDRPEIHKAFNHSQVVHVVDATGNNQGQGPTSFVSFFSTTPGKLTKEVDYMGESFTCGRDKVVDFVTFSVKYGCVAHDQTQAGWSESDIPLLHVTDDTVSGLKRITRISIDTRSSRRWVLAINTEEVEDFKLEGIMNYLFLLYVSRRHPVTLMHHLSYRANY